MTNYWKRLKSYPYLYHLVLIAGVVAGLLLAAHFAMQLGTRHGQHRTVPDFTGLALDDAGRLAQRNSLELRVNDSLFVPAYDGGVVLDQLPHEGTQVKGGRTVYVTINSFSQKKVEVPYVAGRSLRQAKNMLEIAGLEIDRLVYQPDMATNYVLEQRVDGRPIEAGTKRQIEMGSGVTLYVGVAEGDSVVVVPKVIGVSLREAKSRLWEQGFNVGADRPAEPEGCTCLRPAARAGICDGSGFRSGAAPDARRGEGGTRKRRFGQAGAGVERGAGAPAGRTRRFAGRGRGAPPCRGVAARRRDGERRGG